MVYETILSKKQMKNWRMLTFLAMTSGGSVRLMRLPSTGSDLLILDVPSVRDITRAPSLTIRAWYPQSRVLRRITDEPGRRQQIEQRCKLYTVSAVLRTKKVITRAGVRRERFGCWKENFTDLTEATSTWGSLKVFLFRLQNWSLNLQSSKR